ncbi:MAG: thioredoxin domain-containing protein, partial [Myxococcota bacterium]
MNPLNGRLFLGVRLAMAWLVTLTLTLVASGCNSVNPVAKAAPTSPKLAAPTDGPKKQSPQPPNTDRPTSKVEPVDEGSIDADLYPGLPMGLIKPDRRKVVVKVMKAQLCPCPNSTTSMHACLQKESGRCELAVNAGIEAMRRINEGLSEADTLDVVGQFIENAYRTYTFTLSDTPHMGDPKAPVVIVEFADFECPYCRHARDILKQVVKGNKDDVVFYFKQYPLGMHKNAMPAAMAALAAHKQGRFWPMYNLLFDNQQNLSEAKILELAQMLGLNMERFKQDWKSAEIANQIARDRKEG